VTLVFGNWSVSELGGFEFFSKRQDGSAPILFLHGSALVYYNLH